MTSRRPLGLTGKSALGGLVSVVLLIAALGLALYWTTYTISSRSYEQLERHDIQVAVSRAHDAIVNRVDRLSRSVADYAAWDDTYEYVQGRYPSYIDENFLPESMASLGVDFMAIANPDRRSVEGRGVDVASGQPRPVPDYVVDIVKSGKLAAGYDPSQTKGSGIIVTARARSSSRRSPSPTATTRRRPARSS